MAQWGIRCSDWLRLTIHSTGSRFAAPVNSGVSAQGTVLVHSTIKALFAAALATGQAAPALTASSDATVSICKIRRHPDVYLGKVVSVSATYLTDSSHYEYLKDSSCATQNILDIGFVVPERDMSVKAFEAAQASECKRTGQQGLCVLEATVLMRGQIAQTKGAHLQPDLVYLIINPHSVLSYRFLAER